MTKLVCVTEAAYNHLRRLVSDARARGYSATMTSEASRVILAVDNGNQQSADVDSSIRR